ncbi:MAG: insulinase family protein [Veillonella parvula]
MNTGTRCERADENGVSHFIEHLMFKGTQKRTAKDIAEEMDAMGGQINALCDKRIYMLFIQGHWTGTLTMLLMF